MDEIGFFWPKTYSLFLYTSFYSCMKNTSIWCSFPFQKNSTQSIDLTSHHHKHDHYILQNIIQPSNTNKMTVKTHSIKVEETKSYPPSQHPSHKERKITSLKPNPNSSTVNTSVQSPSFSASVKKNHSTSKKSLRSSWNVLDITYTFSTSITSS